MDENESTDLLSCVERREEREGRRETCDMESPRPAQGAKNISNVSRGPLHRHSL